MAEPPYQLYLFSYTHDGSRWSFTIPATSPTDALARCRSLGNARLVGVVAPPLPGGILGKALARVRRVRARVKQRLNFLHPGVKS